MKKGDIILLLVLIIIGVAGCVFFASMRGNESYVVITVDGEIQGTYSLSEDRDITIESENGGENFLQIQYGYADMLSANCPNQDCVHQKVISRNGESIICLPHKVVVTVYEETIEIETDANTY